LVIFLGFKLPSLFKIARKLGTVLLRGQRGSPIGYNTWRKGEDMIERGLSSLLLAKVLEQIMLLERLVELVPGDKLDWRPCAGTFRTDELLGHLLECLAGFCAALYALNPGQLSHFERLRQLPVNHRCGAEEARERIRQYAAHIEEGFSLIGDRDLARRVPTVFVEPGEAALTLLLGNLEHLINHKHQLFFYLKLMGAPVSTADLYAPR
jgi:hypothetical protein